MSNYLRKLGVFHTPPLSVPEDASLTGYVINTNGLKPVRINGDNAFDQGCLYSKMNVLHDTVMLLGIDVLHITETHDSRENFSNPSDTWSRHSSEEGNKSQGAATFTRMATEGASSDINVLQVKVLWEGKAMWLITAYFPNDLPGTINTTRAVDTML